MFNLDFYAGKKVLITGHTGFKGSWLSVMLVNLGAEVIGYSSCSKTAVRLFDLCEIKNQITHIKGDVRDLEHMLSVFQKYQPEIVIHMAAQPIVRDSYDDPVGTYHTNVMGTVNVCEAIRQNPSVRSFLDITTDKVYENKEWEWGYRENEPLDGYDPYSNSKSCSELVTHSYKKSFFDKKIAVSTARAGNVIGGGDFANDRIIPDCVRAAIKAQTVVIRNPYSIRPYQHVLEPLYAYLLITGQQYKDMNYAGYYNVGPDEKDCITTEELVRLFCSYWGDDLNWQSQTDKNAPHEANFLKLDCSRIKSKLGWKPRWDIKKALQKTVEWTKIWQSGQNVRMIMDKQIKEFLGCESYVE